LGKYDITLKFAPEMGQLPPPPGGGAPDGMSPPPPSDPGGPTLQMAVQDQLGLKLESGKGPVELIVIEHIEKPSDN
jgi:bla regulator protein BlaR1